jgi:2-octaprenylphenol hydroxylase
MVKASQYDVIIVGAGMVGAAAACLLARSSLSYKSEPITIALVDARIADPFNAEQFDPRVAAVTESSRHLLERCGVWGVVEAKRVSAYEAMEVWDAEGTGRIHFDCHDIHQPNLGHIVENSLLVTALLQEVAVQPSISFICPVTITDYLYSDDKVTVVLDSGRELCGSLLIAADGANSLIRQHFDIDTKEWDYGHKAIVTTIVTERDNQKTAWQRFMPSGPLALLPLNKEGDVKYSSIVWSQELDEADRLMALDDEQFCAELGRASEQCLGSVLAVDNRFVVPLRQRHAKNYVLPRVALVGDAAHTIHPLAGQGVNLGFSDVEALVDEIGRAIERGNDIGDISTLNRYQRRRKPHNLAAMAVMEGFKRLFSADQLGLRLLRNMGMSGLNRLAPLKNEIIKKAMGL